MAKGKNRSYLLSKTKFLKNTTPGSPKGYWRNFKLEGEEVGIKFFGEKPIRIYVGVLSGSTRKVVTAANRLFGTRIRYWARCAVCGGIPCSETEPIRPQVSSLCPGGCS